MIPYRDYNFKSKKFSIVADTKPRKESWLDVYKKEHSLDPGPKYETQINMS